MTTKDKRSDIPFIGTAVAGKWKSKLPPFAVAEIEAAWGSPMSSMGYKLTQRAEDNAHFGVSTHREPASLQAAHAVEKQG